MIKKSSFFARTTIVVFFTLIIIFGFYLPKIFNFFLRPEKELVVYITRETVIPEIFEEFEKKTGINLRVTFFDTNEEMFAKFKINRGSGYDLVIHSDYMGENLIRENLLQPIDKSKISNFDQIDKRLLDKFYDPGNKYTLPLSWIPYGIGFDKRIINLDNDFSWEIVYKKEALSKFGDFKVSMLNDPKEVVFLTAIYLFGQIENLSNSQIEKIEKTLKKQKEIVECYVEAGAKYLLISKIVPMAVLPSARLKELEDPENFGFVVPREGSLIDIINFGILKKSKKADLVHELIDFLLSKDIGARNFDELACNPSNREAYSLIDEAYSKNKAFFPDDEIFERLYIINNKIQSDVLDKIWFSLKS